MKHPRHPNSNVEAIAAEVAPLLGVSRDELLDGPRLPLLVEARAVAMVVARDRWGFSESELALYFGRDRTTAHAAPRRVARALRRRPALASVLERLTLAARNGAS